MYEHRGRPHLCLRYSVPELIAEFLALAGILLNAYMIESRWTLLPGMAPVNGGVHKLWLLTLGSVLPIGLYVALTMLGGRLDRFIYPVTVGPKNSAVEYRLARRLLLSLKLEAVWASNVALWYLIGVGLGDHASALPAAALVALALAAITATIAYYVWQMKRYA